MTDNYHTPGNPGRGYGGLFCIVVGSLMIAVSIFDYHISGGRAYAGVVLGFVIWIIGVATHGASHDARSSYDEGDSQ